MTATVMVRLEIDGDAGDATHVVDNLLDAGFFQDAINEHDCDAGALHVTSAVMEYPRQFERGDDGRIEDEVPIAEGVDAVVWAHPVELEIGVELRAGGMSSTLSISRDRALRLGELLIAAAQDCGLNH